MPPRGRRDAFVPMFGVATVLVAGAAAFSFLGKGSDVGDAMTGAGLVLASSGIAFVVLAGWAALRRLQRRRHADRPWLADGWDSAGAEHPPPGYFSWRPIERALEEERTSRLRLEWSAFPIHPGKAATLRLRFPKPPVGAVTAELQLVAEHHRWGGLSTVCRVRHAERFRIEAEELRRDLAVELRLDVPADAPGTDLVAEPALHWNLVVRGTPGLEPLAAHLPVPIYARPGA